MQALRVMNRLRGIVDQTQKNGPKKSKEMGRPMGAAADSPLTVRFVCSNDPSRAFIAAALVRSIGRGAASGLAEGELADVHPSARRVMEEIGISLTGLAARSVPAGETVVLIRNRGLAAPRENATWSFDDPATTPDQAASLANFRKVRDEIKRRVDLLLLVKLRQSATGNRQHQPREGNA